MPTIELITHINSGIEICFDLSRSIDLHKLSTSQTKEEAISGVTSGLIELGERVTWRATHFAIRQELTSKITAFDRPFHFRDEQVRGIFKFIRHDHYFENSLDQVVMKDVFDFRSPFGLLGKAVDKVILSAYLTKLLIKRNEMIKEYAETGKWKAILKGSGNFHG